MDWNEAMKDGLPALEVGERLRTTSDNVDQSKRVLAHYLYEMMDRRLFEATGHRDTVHFAETQLDMDRRRANELIRLGGALPTLSVVDDAFRAGLLSFTRTIEILRVVQPHTQVAWVEFATQAKLHELKDEVVNAKPGGLPGEGREFGLKPRMRHLRMKVSEKAERLLERAREALAEDGRHLSDDELILELAELALERMSEYSPEGDAEDPSTDQDPSGANDAPIPAPIRNEVLHRDHHACRSCQTRFDVDIHHVRERSDGGTNDTYNLLSLCRTCHGHVHQSRLQLSATDANHPIEFSSADGTPLHRHRGEYSPASTKPPILLNPAAN